MLGTVLGVEDVKGSICRYDLYAHGVYHLLGGGEMVNVMITHICALVNHGTCPRTHPPPHPINGPTVFSGTVFSGA